ncbi:MAG: magnesium transporter [Tissierellia bacterium]|nr:magnesium transporter [Bacillota bacterium]NLK59098.1 magnesium transporter [Tissierellia bacterium]
MDLRERLLQIVETDDRADANQLFEDEQDIDIAIALSELEDADILRVFALLDDEKKALLLEEEEEDEQIRIINLLDIDAILGIFQHMSSDDITDIVGALSVRKRKDILNLMTKSESEEISQLLSYDPETAGGLMTTEYIALRGSLSAIQALQKLKEIAPSTEVIDTLFVTDYTHRLLGTVDLRNLFAADANERLSEIMEPNPISVVTDTDQEEVSLIVSKYDLQVMPVTNRRGALLGIITIDDIIDVLIDEHTEDMLMMSGVSKDERLDSSIWSSVTKRVPWLIVNLATAFLSSMIVAQFESTIAKVAVLAAIMPIIAGLGGSAGSQTLSVVIRSLAMGELRLRDSHPIIKKQIAVGLINGVLIGTIAAVFVYVILHNWALSLIVFAAMLGNQLIANIIGFIVPVVLAKLNMDPALASSMFVTTTTDIVGFFLLLGLATRMMPHLLTL